MARVNDQDGKAVRLGMKSWTLLVAAAMTLVAGCTNDFPINDYVAPTSVNVEPHTWRVVVSVDADDAVLEAVQDASAAWEAAVTGSCPIRLNVERGSVGKGMPKLMNTITVYVDQSMSAPLAGHALRALDSSNRAMVRFTPVDYSNEYERSYLKLVARHELGHALGLDHEDKGIMRPTTFPDASITEQDAKNMSNFICRFDHAGT